MNPADDRRESRRRRSVLDRIAALRRTRPLESRAGGEGAPVAERRDDARPEQIARLEQRVDHLEAVLEGLQDSMHRESERHDRDIAELRHETRPDAIARSLSDDARRRGI